MAQARRAAEDEGVALNQLINVALAEKVAELRTVRFFRERAKRGDITTALRLLERVGADTPPMPGDELPAFYERKKRSRRAASKEKRDHSLRKASA
jgi:hypothetical protein